MRFNTVYNICIFCILIVMFVGAYLLGGTLYSAGNDSCADTLVENQSADKSMEPIDKANLPRETEKSDYTQSEFYYDVKLRDSEQEYLFEMCSEYDVPCELVLGIMGSETDYTNGRISDNGDWGIMQINEINHEFLCEELGVTDFLDYEQNVLCGVYLLSVYYHKYTDFERIAMCYRYGESRAKEMWDEGIYETDYTRQVVVNIAALKFR